MSVPRETVCAILRSGAGLPFCNLDHLNAWSHSLGMRTQISISSTGAGTPYCSHCHWCGRLIRMPDACLFHEDGNCPANRWLCTRRATEIVSSWTDSIGPPDDDELAILERVACEHPDWPRDEVVEWAAHYG